MGLRVTETTDKTLPLLVPTSRHKSPAVPSPFEGMGREAVTEKPVTKPAHVHVPS